MKNILLFVFTLSFSLFYAQNPVEVGLKKYKDFRIPEKVFVHTDKDIYAAGETIWMAAYLVDGQTHLSGTVTKAIKVDLRNDQGDLILNQILFSDQGHSSGDFAIPASTPPGEYQIVGYTNFQLNLGTDLLFRKNIQIIEGIQENEQAVSTSLNVSNNTITTSQIKRKNNIRFFPEGGDCVSGLPCRMAFVVENEFNEPQATAGYLIDQNGKELIQVISNENGIGKLKYLPNRNQKFWIELSETKERIELPQPISKGFHLNIKHEKDTVKIFAKTNFSRGIDGARIVLSLRGILLLDQKIESENSFIWLMVPKNSIAPGVVVCTLFDYQDSPVAERLFFIAPDIEKTQLEISLNEDQLETRQENEIELQVSSTSISPETLDNSRISLSIVPKFTHLNIQSGDIRTWLLLNSDIDFPIPFDSDLIFGKDSQMQREIIDNFMMTRGWRRFRWKNILSQKNYDLKYEVEEGVFIKGRMGVYEKPNKARPGKIFLTQPDNILSEEKMTDENGYFQFGPYGFYDTLTIYLEGRYKAGKRNRLNPKISRDNNPYVFLELMENNISKIPLVPSIKKSDQYEESIMAYKALSENKLIVAQNYDSMSILLDEVEIEAKRISPEEEERNERTLIYRNPDNRIVVDDLPANRMARTVFDLMRRIPGVTVTGFGTNENALIRGVGSLTGRITPAYFVDGAPVNVDFVRNLQVDNVDFIDVLKTGKAAILGSRAATGAILIYTKTGSSLNNPSLPGLLQIELQGFYKAREFSVFDPTESGNENRPDIRTTIHWNPNLRTDSSGKVKESFITSDQNGEFIMIAHGLRGDGTPLFGTKEFMVE